MDHWILAHSLMMSYVYTSIHVDGWLDHKMDHLLTIHFRSLRDTPLTHLRLREIHAPMPAPTTPTKTNKLDDAAPFVWHFRVYVAGPMYSSGDLVTNARNACDAAHELHTANIPGVRFHCFTPQPYVLATQLVHPRGHVEAQEWDDQWLRVCKFLLRLPGKSTGSDHEEALALELGIPIFYSVAALLEHARDTYSEAPAQLNMPADAFAVAPKHDKWCFCRYCQ